jgi:hypothetical protein
MPVQNQKAYFHPGGVSRGTRAWMLTLAILTGAMVSLVHNAQAAAGPSPVSVAFLNVEFLNDNEMYEPTNDQERARLKALETNLKDLLTRTGRYTFVDVPDAMRDTIAKGQSPGECGGCEIDYGETLEADQVVWIRVQKVSNLILNMNVYLADVASRKMVFSQSVDIRGNTDETWAHSMRWLVKNYLAPPASSS